MFACVYAVKDGCIIKGWMDKEGALNGKKEHCNIYNVECISAKCKTCGHEGIDGCESEAKEAD